MQNQTKYEYNEETKKYDVMYKGFDYNTFSYVGNWKKIREVETEDEAKKVCSDCLDFND